MGLTEYLTTLRLGLKLVAASQAEARDASMAGLEAQSLVSFIDPHSWPLSSDATTEPGQKVSRHRLNASGAASDRQRDLGGQERSVKFADVLSLSQYRGP